MTVQRIALGKLPNNGLAPNGSIGLRVSMPGYDVSNGTPGLMSFDSSWPDVFPLYATGTFGCGTYFNATSLHGTAAYTAGVGFPDLGYIPVASFMILGTAWNSQIGYPNVATNWMPASLAGLIYYQDFSSSVGNSLRIVVQRGYIGVTYLLTPGSGAQAGQVQGYPIALNIAYALFRRPAF